MVGLRPRHRIRTGGGEEETGAKTGQGSEEDAVEHLLHAFRLTVCICGGDDVGSSRRRTLDLGEEISHTTFLEARPWLSVLEFARAKSGLGLGALGGLVQVLV